MTPGHGTRPRNNIARKVLLPTRSNYDRRRLAVINPFHPTCPRTPMNLANLLPAWSTPSFESTAKQAIRALDPNLLPLQQGLTHSSTASAEQLDVRIISATASDDQLRIKAGLFYTGIIAGCNCSDDPSSVEPINEYCEVLFEIDRRNGAATVSLLPD